MTFRLGLNYWPSASAMYWWRRFDAGEVHRDFARIREAGFDSVRIFLLWEDFQPAPDLVSQDALERLIKVADAAGQTQLSLLPTLFTGHMSGVNWVPGWALDPKHPSASETPSRFRVVSGGRVVIASLKNWYVDRGIEEAQAMLAREIATAIHGHNALWAWDLGNENSNCCVPPTRQSALAWLDRISGEIRAVDRRHPITIGLHMEDLEEDRRLGPQEAASVCEFLCMHGYPIYAEWADGPTDEMVLPFLGLMTCWLGGKDVLFEEFGAPAVSRRHPRATSQPAGSGIPLLDEEGAGSYIRRSLDALHRFGFSGAMVWCYGDYARGLWNEPPLDESVHERFFGLWRFDSDGSATPKPALAEVRRFRGLPRRESAGEFPWIDIDKNEFYSSPREHLRRLYRRFRETYQAAG
ncbi:MAG TPA: hypothetical protein VFV34_17200 [Blastocatellia bacterium]|nr:hypothetical protein [Blastocatellia bacterium]